MSFEHSRPVVSSDRSNHCEKKASNSVFHNTVSHNVRYTLLLENIGFCFELQQTLFLHTSRFIFFIFLVFVPCSVTSIPDMIERLYAVFTSAVYIQTNTGS
jgi:hypothetical protein